ncbi:MAG: DUF3859 domain-containing protein [Cyclobacteriaceae bacterium]
MKKTKKTLPKVEIINYGLYETWDREDKALPGFLELTDRVKAIIGVEFGMIVKIWQAKGRYIDYRIDHPPFVDESGNIEPPFEGQYRVRSSDFEFFIGDTIWEPVEDKRGEWKMSVFLDGTLLATKSILLY